MKIEIIKEWDAKIDRFFYVVSVNGKRESVFIYEAEAHEAVQRIKSNHLQPINSEIIHSEEF